MSSARLLPIGLIAVLPFAAPHVYAQDYSSKKSCLPVYIGISSLLEVLCAIKNTPKTIARIPGEAVTKPKVNFCAATFRLVWDFIV